MSVGFSFPVTLGFGKVTRALLIVGADDIHLFSDAGKVSL
jgi:hypothetical protein